MYQCMCVCIQVVDYYSSPLLIIIWLFIVHMRQISTAMLCGLSDVSYRYTLGRVIMIDKVIEQHPSKDGHGRSYTQKLFGKNDISDMMHIFSMLVYMSV